MSDHNIGLNAMQFKIFEEARIDRMKETGQNITKRAFLVFLSTFWSDSQPHVQREIAAADYEKHKQLEQKKEAADTANRVVAEATIHRTIDTADPIEETE